MALTDEQRSMLQLLLGGQSYDDIASLLGIPRDEVRARARAGLTEIGGADPDTEVAVSDYLLGQADPIGRADAVRHLQGDQDANALVSRLVAQLRLLVPAAELPEIPAPRGGRRTGSGADAGTAGPSTVPGAGTPSAPAPSHPGSGVPPAPPTPPGGGRRRGPGSFLDGLSGERRTQLLVGLGALGLLLVVGVLAIAGVFGGGDGGSECATITATSAQEAGLPAIQLEPAAGAPSLEGCTPTGQVVFAQGGQGQQVQVALQANLGNLAPTDANEMYVVWLFRDAEAAIPLAQDQVGPDGDLTGAAPLTPQLLGSLGQFRSINVSLTSSDEFEAEATQAQEEQRIPGYVGTTVLTGAVPNLGQATGGDGEGRGGNRDGRQGDGGGGGGGQQ
jgi:hypothetical protein